MHLLPSLREQGWCEITAYLLVLPEHNAFKKVLQTLGALLVTCWGHYCQDPQLSRMVVSLQAEYQALILLNFSLPRNNDLGTILFLPYVLFIFLWILVYFNLLITFI